MFPTTMVVGFSSTAFILKHKHLFVTHLRTYFFFWANGDNDDPGTIQKYYNMAPLQ